MVVGFSAGGGTDVVARILAQKISESMGQSVVVENRAGASGMIAGEAVAKSAADGYTLMMGSQTTFAVAPTLYRKISLDPARDFAGVAMAAISPLVLVVHPSVPAQSVKDVIAMAKAKPGTINFGSGGLGTTPHMTGELFSSIAGIKMAHVAYRGEAPAINDLHRRANSAHVREPVRRRRQCAGRAAACARRHQRAARGGRPRYPHGGGGGAARFRGSDVVRTRCAGRNAARHRSKLNAEVKRALALPDVKQRFADLGMTAEDSTPEGLDAYIRSEIAKWTKVIKDADIKATE